MDRSAATPGSRRPASAGPETLEVPGTPEAPGTLSGPDPGAEPASMPRGMEWVTSTRRVSAAATP